MPAYDPGVDYSALIAQEAAKGVHANRQLLARYEAQCNAKITGERLPYSQTAVYTGELGRPLGYYEASDRSDYINEIYDAARELSIEALESAYERNTAAYDYAAAQIPLRYRSAKNALASDAALARQSVNEQFAASGLNTGAAGQARLSLAIANSGAMAALDSERAAALDKLELERANAQAEYRAAVAESIAESELERAKALYDEAVRVEASYKAYSEELLAAWGLTPAGLPTAQAASAQASPAPAPAPAGKREDGAAAEAELEDNAAYLRQLLARIPGLTRENMAALIRDYYDAGRISFDSMRELLGSI